MGMLRALGLLIVLGALVSAEGPYVFHGKFRGKCEMGKDGLYYRDERTFAVCSHGNAYVQPCPAGTKNAEYNDFFHGKKYHYNQFCDVNLVDQTITTHAQVYGSYRPPRLGNQHGGTQNTGAAYGTSSSTRQHGHRLSGYEYTDTAYERDNKRTGGLSNGGTYQTGGQSNGGTYQTGEQSNGGTYQTGGQSNGGTYQTGGQSNGGTYQTGRHSTGGTPQTGGQSTGGTYQTGGLGNGGTYQTGGQSTGGTYQRTNTRQQQPRPRYGSVPMTLEETYNTFFNAAGFHGRIPFGVNANYRFRAYPRYYT